METTTWGGGTLPACNEKKGPNQTRNFVKMSQKDLTTMKKGVNWIKNKEKIGTKCL